MSQGSEEITSENVMAAKSSESLTVISNQAETPLDTDYGQSVNPELQGEPDSSSQLQD